MAEYLSDFKAENTFLSLKPQKSRDFTSLASTWILEYLA